MTMSALIWPDARRFIVPYWEVRTRLSPRSIRKSRAKAHAAKRQKKRTILRQVRISELKIDKLRVAEYSKHDDRCGDAEIGSPARHNWKLRERSRNGPTSMEELSHFEQENCQNGGSELAKVHVSG